MVNLLQALDGEMAALVVNVRRSLVQINGDEGSIGAGTIWHSDGLIVTNAHVVVDRQNGRQRNLSVELADGRNLPASLVAYDLERDLAALAVTAEDLPTIALGDSATVRPAQWVLAIGHPWGIADSLTAGIVIGVGADLPEQAGREWIALSLNLRPGHSGGPLVDVDGRLLGINTMISGPDVGFAIPVNLVKTFLKEALGSNGHQPQTQPQPYAEPMMV